MKNHTRRPRAEYEALFARKVATGITYEALSAETGVPSSTLQYWFRKLRREGNKRGTSEDTGPFVRVSIADPAPSAVEVVLGDNVRLLVRPGFDELTVRRLVNALGC